jgi:hypothetical protein
MAEGSPLPERWRKMEAEDLGSTTTSESMGVVSPVPHPKSISLPTEGAVLLYSGAPCVKHLDTHVRRLP